MVTVTIHKTKTKSGRVRYLGAVRGSRALGITRQHLFLFLKGERSSARLRRSIKVVTVRKSGNATKGIVE